jgi:hypothetical protein
MSKPPRKQPSDEAIRKTEHMIAEAAPKLWGRALAVTILRHGHRIAPKRPPQPRTGR